MNCSQHDIAEILLKLALNTNQYNKIFIISSNSEIVLFTIFCVFNYSKNVKIIKILVLIFKFLR